MKDEEHDAVDHNQFDGVGIDLHLNLDRYSMFGADVYFVPTYFAGSTYYGGGYVSPIAAAQRIGTPGGLQVGITF